MLSYFYSRDMTEKCGSARRAAKRESTGWNIHTLVVWARQCSTKIPISSHCQRHPGNAVRAFGCPTTSR